MQSSWNRELGTHDDGSTEIVTVDEVSEATDLDLILSRHRVVGIGSAVFEQFVKVGQRLENGAPTRTAASEEERQRSELDTLALIDCFEPLEM